MDDWHIVVDGSARGPFDRLQVAGMLQRDEVEAQSLVWREGQDDWRPLRDTPLSVLLPPLPPALPMGAPSPGGEAAAARGGGGWTAQDLAEAAVRVPMVGRGGHVPAGVGGPPAVVVEDGGWQDVDPAPWRRYLGRVLDTLAFGLAFFSLMAVASSVFAPAFFDAFWGEGGLANNMLFSAMATFFVTLFFSGVLVGLTGTTPGKWLFGTRITRADGRPIGVVAALGREFDVYIRGVGFGVPVISLVTCLIGCGTLAREGSASWDIGKPWRVTHRSGGVLQSVLFLVGLGSVLGIRIFSQWLART